MRAMVARLRQEERGQNMVEMALLLPILLVLVFGVIEFARAYNYSDQTSQVANETARWIIVNQLPAYTTPNGVNGCVQVAGCPQVANNVPTVQKYRDFAYARLVTQGLRTTTPNPANIHICTTGSGGVNPPTDAAMVLLKTSFTPVAGTLIGFANFTIKGSATMKDELPSTDQTNFEAAASCS